jgi:hypothetical protein
MDISLRSEGLNPSELMSRLRRSQVSSGHSRVEAGRSLNAALTRHHSGRLLKRMANVFLRLLGVGDTLKFAARRAS